MKCPCIDCADRQAICHDTCVRFAAYRKPLDAAIAQRVQVQQAQVQQAQLALQDMKRSRHLTMRRMARRCAAARE